MAELTTFARPYAKAAFAFALDKGELSKWSEMLALAAVVCEDRAFRAALTNPALTAEQQAQAVIDVCADKLTEGGREFFQALALNKRLVLIPEVSKLYEALKADQEQSAEVQVISAFELSSSEQEQLAQSLKTRLKRSITMSCIVDKTLIGGLIIRAGDMVIDGSVRGKLAKMAEAIHS
ncbi:F0F1 ATP synthase subunit delta [Balneatrix alpica]|uniref:ATP synthase subunit delta n=1 Tax=Balneatrix alpica TaxID=75684 RepID=A0ABV5Z9W1_9GAMM|nr:F0F1 ATP synthase subunit delta [Balneatrix alpica]